MSSGTTFPSEKIIRRINIFGGPGCGKSTAAHFLMWKLKQAYVVAEMSRECIKREAFKDPATLPEPGFLQSIFSGRQLEEELAALATGAVVVTDSPILLQGAYAPNPHERARCINAACRLDELYPSLNIFLLRGDKKFEPRGRWGSEVDAGRKCSEIEQLLIESGRPYCVINHDNWDHLWDAVKESLKIG